MQNASIAVRLARPADFKQMCEIYRHYVENTAVSFETEPPGCAEFSGRIRRIMEKYPCLVAEEGGKVIGYTYAAAFKERAAYNWAVETTIYLHRDARRRGVGRMLYTALEEILRAQGICNVNACIGVPREENEPYLSRDSVNFHTRMGYRLVGEFDCCGSKFGRWYNMVWMEKHIRNHPAQPDPVKWFPDVRAQFSNYEPEK